MKFRSFAASGAALLFVAAGSASAADLPDSRRLHSIDPITQGAAALWPSSTDGPRRGLYNTLIVAICGPWNTATGCRSTA